MSSDNVLNGSLDFLSLAEVMQLLNANGANGVLRLVSPYASEPGLVYFQNGDIINAVCPEKNGLEAAYSLFGWMDGEFEFTRGNVATKRLIQSALMELVLDGLRMIDDEQVPRLGPETLSEVQVEEDTGAAPPPPGNIPVIKRPVSNYGYVVDEEEIPDGNLIVQEGAHGNWVCIILEGYADVLRQTPGDPIPIVRLGPGALVGNITSLLIGKSTRTATLVAAGTCVLGVLDLQRIHNEFSLISFELRELAVSLDKRLKEITDRIVEVNTTKINVVEFIGDKKTYSQQGSDDETLKIITAGEAAIVRKTSTGIAPLARLGRGDFLGKWPFSSIGHEPHNAAVVASEDLETKDVDLVSLTHEFEQTSPMIKAILDHVATGLTVTTSVLVSALEKAAASPVKDKRKKKPGT